MSMLLLCILKCNVPTKQFCSCPEFAFSTPDFLCILNLFELRNFPGFRLKSLGVTSHMLLHCVRYWKWKEGVTQINSILTSHVNRAIQKRKPNLTLLAWHNLSHSLFDSLKRKIPKKIVDILRLVFDFAKLSLNFNFN